MTGLDESIDIGVRHAHGEVKAVCGGVDLSGAARRVGRLKRVSGG